MEERGSEESQGWHRKESRYGGEMLVAQGHAGRQKHEGEECKEDARDMLVAGDTPGSKF